MVWLRRAAWSAGALVALLLATWALAWIAVPALVRWQAPLRLTEATGRPVTIGAVSFKPWSLELQVGDLMISGTPSDTATTRPPLLRIERLYANLQMSSIWRRAPVIQALDIARPVVHVTRTAPGHYDVDNLIAKFTPKPGAAPATPAPFALANVRITDGAFTFDDRPEGKVHRVQRLTLSVPFLSRLPADVAVVVEPHLAFDLNGAAFDSGAQTTPFGAERRSKLTLQFGGTAAGQPEIDLAPYLGYLPDELPLRLDRGKLGGDIALSYALRADGTPQLALSGTLRLRDVSISDPQASGVEPLLAWQNLVVPMRDVQPLARIVQLGALTLDGARVVVARDAQGRIVLPHVGRSASATATRSPGSAASTASAGSPASAVSLSAPAWRLAIDSIAMKRSSIRWTDATTRPAVAMTVDNINLDASALRWPIADPVAIDATATVAMPGRPQPAKLTLRGAANGTQAGIDWSIDGVSLQVAAPYLAQMIVPTASGLLGANGRLDWHGGPEPRTTIAIAQARLDDLTVISPAAAASASASAKPRAGSTSDADRQRRRDEAFTLKQLTLSNVNADLKARKLDIGAVAARAPSLRIVRDDQGVWNVQQWMVATSAVSGPAPSASASASAPTSPTPWRVSVKGLQLDGGQLRLTDRRPRAGVRADARPVRVRLSDLQLSMQGIAWGDPKAAPARVSLSSVVGRSVDDMPRAVGGRPAPVARIEWQGEFAPEPLLARGDLRLSRVPVEAFERYVDNPLRIELARAAVGYRGSFSVARLPAGIAAMAQGTVRIDDFSLLARAGTVAASTTPAVGVSPAAQRAGPTSPDELVRWERVALTGVDFAMAPGTRPRLDIAQAEIGDFYSRLVVTEEGRLNLVDVTRIDRVKPEGAASSASAASAPALADAQPLPIDISLGATRLTNGRIDFADHFVKPNYSAALTDLTGAIGAVKSGVREMADIELRGRAEGSALLDIKGRVNPFAKPLALDVRAKATDLELAPLSTYAGKYAGYAIERGKLSMDVHYRIDGDGRLEASNQVVLNQLTFGEKIDSATATRLPVRLAVALLKDRRGVIDLNLPISGSLKDPQFSIVGLIGRVIGNVLVKAVTSPFSLLSGVGGRGAGGDPSQIEFALGSAMLPASQQATIDKIATALQERPGLSMTITGSSDISREGDSYRRSTFEDALQAQAYGERGRAARGAASAGPVGAAASSVASSVAASASASASETVTLDASTRARLVAERYERTPMRGKPRNVIGLEKGLPVVEMEQRLMALVEVTPEAMRELALKRGLAVRDALIAKGLKSDRLFLAAPRVDDGPAASAASAPASSALPASSADGEPAPIWAPKVKLTLQAG